MNAAKDMHKVYAQTTTEALIRNQMKKMHALYHVRMERGYWARKECARLEYLMHQIDQELERRVNELGYFKG